jgi:sulfur-carrier protein adenylyltransferase/sulfurtransferase
MSGPIGGHPLLDEVNPAELALELEGDAPPMLVDVRTPMERQMASIEPSLHLDLSEFIERAPDEIPHDADVVIYCHTGMRSAQAAMWMKANGWSRARSLAGGIDEWSVVVDRDVPRY